MASESSREPALIRAAQRGNLEAFNELVVLHQDRVYALAYRIMGDRDSAADAAQDAFISAFRKLNTYRGGVFRSWLLRITANTCYDALRYQKRRPATGLDDLPGGDTPDGPPVPSSELTPEEAVQQLELARAIESCIQGLHADQRMVMVLSDVEGLSYQEVAETTGANLGTVKSRLSRARAAVRACLGAAAELLPAEYRLVMKQ